MWIKSSCLRRKMSGVRAKVIVNPVAGAGSTRHKWPLIKSQLKYAGLSFDHQFTESKGHAIELAKSAASDGYRYLVAVGGDGTIHEVANGILQSANNNNASLGIISTGTGSDLARSIGVPRHYVNACSCLTSPRRVIIDAGVVEYWKNGEKRQRYFVNSAGVGFDAAVVESTEKISKRFGGTIPYLTGLVKTLFGYHNKNVTVAIDGKVESSRILSLVVANGRYFGGGMQVAPKARLDDSLFDLIIIGDIGKFELLKAMPMVYKGTHLAHPKVRMARATQVTIESKEKFLVHADGEILGEGPASFRLLPGALSIVT